jgi:hypothetical protein
MVTPSTFTGVGFETSTYSMSGDSDSLSFQILDGIIAPNSEISWLCDGADQRGKWGTIATVSSDGLTMKVRSGQKYTTRINPIHRGVDDNTYQQPR